MQQKRTLLLLLANLLLGYCQLYSQNCTGLGQTPGSAFPVCGTTVFTQTSVPLCVTNSLFVPGCSGGGTGGYENRNPYWYKIHCYQTGTLGFTITPTSPTSDYDWQLYDVTGLNPDEVFTNRNIIVTGNWAGSYGPTGASDAGVGFIQCGSDPSENKNTFAKMPNLIAGRDYLLMVSHFTNTQSGYSLSFNGGTAVITDPKKPLVESLKPDCDGRELTVKFNKPVTCKSLTAAGTEFTLSPAVAGITSVVSNGCNSGFDFTELTIRLSNNIPAGDYQLIISNGTDGNTILDNCDNAIADGTAIDFKYIVPQPIFADSIGSVGCAPEKLNIYFPKKIDCASINTDGSNFLITGPEPVQIASVQNICTGGETDVITLNLTKPIQTGGLYSITFQTGVDGSTIVDECGLNLPVHTRSFTAYDTVNAEFSFNSILGCRNNIVQFSHNGANQVNSWVWDINSTRFANVRNTQASFSASSTNQISLKVSNGVCDDEYSTTLVMNNEVKTGFEIPAIICPEDPLVINNTSSGLIDNWRWELEGFGSSNLASPAPIQYPITNREAVYNIKQVVSNNTLGCSDSLIKKLRVLNNCYIAVPTAFTPNGDGLNDYLYPNNAMKADNLEFRVYNRYGQQVFYTRDWTKKWDGRVNGVLQTTGVYVWFLSYTHRDTGQKVFQKGTTTLIL